MLGFLRRKPKRLQVFRFVGQHGPEYRDPVIVRRRLELALPAWGEMVDLLAKRARPLPAGAEALEAKRQTESDGMIEELAAAVTAAFDLPALNAEGKGYSEAERLTVLASFLAYCADVAEQTRPLAVGLPSTGLAAAN